MRTILALLCFACSAFADVQTDTRVRIALALSAAEQAAPKPPDIVIPPSKPDPPKALTYAQAVAECLRIRKPMVVFIGYQHLEIADCIVCHDNGLADVAQVWIGVPKGQTIYRKIIMGNPSIDDIRAGIHILDKQVNAPPQVSTGNWSNSGSCRCQTTTGKCQCIPASRCPNGCPVQPQAAPQQPQFTLPQWNQPMGYLPIYGGRICRT